jgi:hypothetical protein
VLTLPASMVYAGPLSGLGGFRLGPLGSLSSLTNPPDLIEKRANNVAHER